MNALEISWATDRGQSREHNEDASFVWQFVLALPQQAVLDLALLIVADGMGGLASGERASALAVRTAAEHIVRRVALPLLMAEPGAMPQLDAPLHEILIGGIHLAHQSVSREVPGAGTTMTVALVVTDTVYIAHVGDTRAYLGDGDKLVQLTQDHSLAARLAELGQSSAEESPGGRNVLYKAVGLGVEPEPDVAYHTLTPGQYLLLCCDGLWGQVSEREMAETVAAAGSAASACQALVVQANAHGGIDNITVALAARGWPVSDGS